MERQLEELPRKEIAARSLEHSKLILIDNMELAVEMMNRYAPEHLIIETKNYHELAEKIVNAGSVFLGAYSPESAGDMPREPTTPCRPTVMPKPTAV